MDEVREKSNPKQSRIKKNADMKRHLDSPSELDVIWAPEYEHAA